MSAQILWVQLQKENEFEWWKKKMEHAGYGRPDFAVLFRGRALLHICGPSVSLAFSASVFSPPHFLQFCTLISCVHQNFNKKSETIIQHIGRWIFVKPVNCVARRPDWSHQYCLARKCREKCRTKKKGGGGIQILILCLRTQREDWKQRPEISAFPQLHRL